MILKSFFLNVQSKMLYRAQLIAPKGVSLLQQNKSSHRAIEYNQIFFLILGIVNPKKGFSPTAIMSQAVKSTFSVSSISHDPSKAP